MNVSELIAGIRSDDLQVRAEAWRHAGPVGPAALPELAELVLHDDIEVSRAARRAMWKIVRHAGRPGADAEKAATVRGLLDLLEDRIHPVVSIEVMWMLSEIGGDESVEAIASLLRDERTREDARMVLERIEGPASLAALQSALENAPDDFKLNIAQSLRQRGVQVDGLPCQKLVPIRQTDVRPVGR